MEPNCLICNKIEVLDSNDYGGGGCTIKSGVAVDTDTSKLSSSVDQTKLQIDRNKSVQVLLKLLYISPTPFLEDVLGDSVFCSNCLERFLSVHQAFTELEVVQGKIAQVRRVIEHDLVASLEQQEWSSQEMKLKTSSSAVKPSPLGLTRDIRKYICDLIQPKTINACGSLPGVGLDKFIHTNNDLISSLDQIDYDPVFAAMNSPVTQLQGKAGFNSEKSFFTYNNTATPYVESDTDTDIKTNLKSDNDFDPGPKSKRKKYKSCQKLDNERRQLNNNENVHQPNKSFLNENCKNKIVQNINRISKDTSVNSSASSVSFVINNIEMKPALVLQKIIIDPNKKSVNISKDSKIKKFIIKEKIYIKERKREVLIKKKFIQCLICNKNVIRKRFNQHTLIHEGLERKEKCDKSYQLKPKPKKRPAGPENADGTNANTNINTNLKTKDKELAKKSGPRSRLKCHDVGKINRNIVK